MLSALNQQLPLETQKILFLTVLIALPIIYLVCGILLRFLSYKRMSRFFGYRTPQAYHSKETWKFSNKLSGMLFLITGIIFVIVFPLLMIIFWNDYNILMVVFTIAIIVEVLTIILILIVVEILLYKMITKLEEKNKTKSL